MKEVIFNTNTISYQNVDVKRSLLIVYSGNNTRGVIIKVQNWYKYTEVADVAECALENTCLFDLYLELKDTIPDLKICVL